eukprot:753004-Rhodomonas_salina.1
MKFGLDMGGDMHASARYAPTPPIPHVPYDPTRPIAYTVYSIGMLLRARYPTCRILLRAR